MFPASSSGFPHPWIQALQPVQPELIPLLDASSVQKDLKSLKETLDLLKSVQKELDTLHLIKTAGGLDEPSSSQFTDIAQKSIESIKDKKTHLDVQESLAEEAANSLRKTLNFQLERINHIFSDKCSWEERSMAARLGQKLQKHQRNKRWKKKRRKLIAENVSKEREMFHKADQEVDEWRAREIAKDIAKRKVEKMKAIAKIKAKAEKKKLESELELILVVEKLQELRSIRVQKLKKQGHFFPEEDDKFLERVRESVEEEERQAAAAAETSAAKEAIAAAEVSWKAADNRDSDIGVEAVEKDDLASASGEDRKPLIDEDEKNSARTVVDSVASLPLEFYHYYHGSSNDLGTLIEVRRNWDAYIKPGGSRIPGHWVQPPPPSDEVWASYLVGHRAH